MSPRRAPSPRRKQMVPVSGITVAAVIVAVIVIGVLVTGVLTLRRRRLQRRFGPEYDRLVGQGHSKLKTESELAG
jgi:hypothetical protein